MTHRRRPHIAHAAHAALVLGLAIGSVACGSDDGTSPPPPAATGSVEATTATAGESIDADGYVLTVDGGAGQAIGVNATLTVDDVEIGSRSVELGDVASNCAISGDNPRTVSVPDGGVATTVFAVTCTGLGSVEITTSTTGGALDPDGFAVSVGGGTEQQIGVNANLTVDEVPAGAQNVALTDVAGNCTVAGENPREVAVAADETASTEFEVTCIAPIEGQIVFTTDRDGNSEIYVMNEDGTNPVRLTNDPASDREPTVSPDGTRIAFNSDRDGNSEIYVMNADGSDPVNLTNHPASESFPAWSPDGSQIAFTSGRSGDLQIWVMNADGSEQTNLSNMPGSSSAYPDWSPDGSQIAFTTNRDGSAEIYVMNADGSGQTNLTNNPTANDWFATWSPNGTRILFRSQRDGNSEIYVMNADGSGQTNLSNNPASETMATWSPDGTRIAFATDRDDELKFEIYAMNADGSGLSNLSSAPGTSEWTGYARAWR